MAAKTHVKRGDEVVVITGNSKGKTGKILQVLTKKNRVLIEGVNMITKAVKPSQKNQQGGLIQREGSIHISNVKLAAPKAEKAEAPAAAAKPAKAPAKKAAKKKAN